MRREREKTRFVLKGIEGGKHIQFQAKSERQLKKGSSKDKIVMMGSRTIQG
jgi:hypothetical protein